MLDSTEPQVIEAGLELLGGRCDRQLGQLRGRRRPRLPVRPGDADLVKEHGAAVVALCIDEEGQARTARLEGAGRRPADRRPHRRTGACAVEDIVVDCLTFPIGTGQEETRRDGIETIEAIRELKRRHPEVQTTLGVSNVSFGLNPAARQVLNSVFLHECVNAGLDSAIVHAVEDPADGQDPGRAARGRARPGLRPPPRGLRPAAAVPGAVRGRRRRRRRGESRAEELAALPLYERLERRIVDGERNGLEADLDAALETRPAAGDHQRHAAGRA